MAGDKKAALRKLLLGRRDGISHDLAGISAARIRANLRRIPRFRDAASVGLYYPAGSEVPTQGIMQEAISNGVAVCLPRVRGGRALDFREIAGFSSLEPGSFGLMEPKESCPPAPPMDAVVAPAVGASADGHRIGYGGGFYDRYLAGSGAAKIALCFQRQVVGAVPREGHDVRMDYVVTEERIYGL